MEVLELRKGTLRSVIGGDGMMVWWYPGDNHLGLPSGDQNWWQTVCWFTESIETEFAQLRNHGRAISDHEFAQVIGEIDDLLTHAQHGFLNSGRTRSNRQVRAIMARCKRVPGVAEIRLPTPIYINGIEVLGRIYYSEPQMIDGLLSLNFQAKDAGDPQWREVQDAVIDESQLRGNNWLARYRKSST